ncbi:hypothetical protein ACF061_00915 [Streptomyces sp. NPDC015220]|uniref:hypothetical protein n=1 Tax=Streptomyces sp. NPDC015220 TaxID=3364947 RepID=UPI0036F4DC5A
MKVAASPCPAPLALSTQHLMDTPLDALLAELDVDVSVLEAGPGFTGGTYVRDDGSVLLARPAGRPEAEWEMLARAMLGCLLRVPMPPLPEPYQLTVIAK